MVGVCTGFAAGAIDIGAEWMSDLKEGVCMEQLWFNKEACCWSNSVKFGDSKCSQWNTWSEVFDLATDNYLLNYFFYVFSSFTFAALTVILVMYFAPYACGSGIPEVRTYF